MRALGMARRPLGSAVNRLTGFSMCGVTLTVAIVKLRVERRGEGLQVRLSAAGRSWEMRLSPMRPLTPQPVVALFGLQLPR